MVWAVSDAQPSAPLDLMQVDDDLHHCIFVERARRQLKLPGRVVSLHDGDQAIARLADVARPRPELLLLDWKMHGRDGSEVLRWVRQQAHLASMAVVIVSGSDFADHKRQAADLGANEYFAKPQGFDGYEVLAKRIEEFRHGRRLQDRWREPGAAVARPCLSSPGALVGSSSMHALSTMTTSFPAPAQLATQLEAFTGVTGVGALVRDLIGTVVQAMSGAVDPELLELTAVCRKYKLDPGLAMGRCADLRVVAKRHKVIEELIAREWDDPTLEKWFGLSKRTLVRLRGSRRAAVVQLDGATLA